MTICILCVGQLFSTIPWMQGCMRISVSVRNSKTTIACDFAACCIFFLNYEGRIADETDNRQ